MRWIRCQSADAADSFPLSSGEGSAQEASPRGMPRPIPARWIRWAPVGCRMDLVRAGGLERDRHNVCLSYRISRLLLESVPHERSDLVGARTVTPRSTGSAPSLDAGSAPSLGQVAERGRRAEDLGAVASEQSCHLGHRRHHRLGREQRSQPRPGTEIATPSCNTWGGARTLWAPVALVAEPLHVPCKGAATSLRDSRRTATDGGRT